MVIPGYTLRSSADGKLIGEHQRRKRGQIGQEADRRHHRIAIGREAMKRLEKQNEHEGAKRSAEILLPAVDAAWHQGHSRRHCPNAGCAEDASGENDVNDRLTGGDLAQRVLQERHQHGEKQAVPPPAERQARGSEHQGEREAIQAERAPREQVKCSADRGPIGIEPRPSLVARRGASPVSRAAGANGALWRQNAGRGAGSLQGHATGRACAAGNSSRRRRDRALLW